MTTRKGGSTASDSPFGRFLSSAGALDKRIIIVYGASADIVDAAASAIAQHLRAKLPILQTYDRLSAAEAAQDPARLHDHFAAQGLFGDAALLRLDGVTEAQTKWLSPILAELDPAQSDNRLLLASSDLRKQSNFLSVLRTNPDFEVLTAYDVGLDSAALGQMLNARGLPRLAPQLVDRLSDYAAENGPALLDLAIQKLALAAEPDGGMDEAVFNDTLPETGASGADALAERLFAGDHAGLLLHLEQMRAEGESDARFVAQLSRLCLDVRRAQPGQAAGRPRPLFWKTDKIVRRAQQRLDRMTERLDRALIEIQQAERILRSSEPLAPIIAERLCLRTARCFASSGRMR